MTLDRIRLAATVLALLAAPAAAYAHGDVAPQNVDTSTLPDVEEEAIENPYRDSEAFDAAVKVGESAFAQNCARCHGLGAVSGGLAPDLRYLYIPDDDEYYYGRVVSGFTQNGMTKMPAFGEVFDDKAVWAIKSYLDTLTEE